MQTFTFHFYELGLMSKRPFLMNSFECVNHVGYVAAFWLRREADFGILEEENKAVFLDTVNATLTPGFAGQ